MKRINFEYLFLKSVIAMAISMFFYGMANVIKVYTTGMIIPEGYYFIGYMVNILYFYCWGLSISVASVFIDKYYEDKNE